MIFKGRPQRDGQSDAVRLVTRGLTLLALDQYLGETTFQGCAPVTSLSVS